MTRCDPNVPRCHFISSWLSAPSRLRMIFWPFPCSIYSNRVSLVPCVRTLDGPNQQCYFCNSQRADVTPTYNSMYRHYFAVVISLGILLPIQARPQNWMQTTEPRREWKGLASYTD